MHLSPFKVCMHAPDVRVLPLSAGVVCAAHCVLHTVSRVRALQPQTRGQHGRQ